MDLPLHDSTHLARVYLQAERRTCREMDKWVGVAPPNEDRLGSLEETERKISIKLLAALAREVEGVYAY